MKRLPEHESADLRLFGLRPGIARLRGRFKFECILTAIPMYYCFLNINKRFTKPISEQKKMPEEERLSSKIIENLKKIILQNDEAASNEF